MKLLRAPWLPLAVVILIAFGGIVGAIDNVQNPYALFCILGLMALGFLGIGLGELRAGGAHSTSSEPGAASTISPISSSRIWTPTDVISILSSRPIVV
jgi:hypothetical protein